MTSAKEKLSKGTWKRNPAGGIYGVFSFNDVDAAIGELMKKHIIVATNFPNRSPGSYGDIAEVYCSPPKQVEKFLITLNIPVADEQKRTR